MFSLGTNDYVLQAAKVQINYILLAMGTILSTYRVPPQQQAFLHFYTLFYYFISESE